MSGYDVSVQPFKQWARLRLKQGKRDAIEHLGRRIVEDTRLPTSGSKALYLAHLRSKGYSADDLQVFERAWQEMTEPAPSSGTMQGDTQTEE